MSTASELGRALVIVLGSLALAIPVASLTQTVLDVVGEWLVKRLREPNEAPREPEPIRCGACFGTRIASRWNAVRGVYEAVRCPFCEPVAETISLATAALDYFAIHDSARMGVGGCGDVSAHSDIAERLHAAERKVRELLQPSRYSGTTRHSRLSSIHSEPCARIISRTVRGESSGTPTCGIQLPEDSPFTSTLNRSGGPSYFEKVKVNLALRFVAMSKYNYPHKSPCTALAETSNAVRDVDWCAWCRTEGRSTGCALGCAFPRAESGMDQEVVPLRSTNQPQEPQTRGRE